MITKTLAVYQSLDNPSVEVVRELTEAPTGDRWRLASRPKEVTFQYLLADADVAQIAEVEEKMAPLAQRLQELQQERAQRFSEALARAEKAYNGRGS